MLSRSSAAVMQKRLAAPVATFASSAAPKKKTTLLREMFYGEVRISLAYVRRIVACLLCRRVVASVFLFTVVLWQDLGFLMEAHNGLSAKIVQEVQPLCRVENLHSVT